MTTKQIHILTLILVLIDIPIGIGDKLVSIPFLPGWLAQSWPIILMVALSCDKALRIIFAMQAPTEAFPPVPTTPIKPTP